jgi:carbonic anhydrase
MDVVETLTGRNTDFAANRFSPGLRLMPSLKTIVIGCVDPRVDPNAVLGVAPGEVGTIRNVGGPRHARRGEQRPQLAQQAQQRSG